MRALSLLSLAMSLSFFAGPAVAQDVKGKSTPMEVWAAFREQMADGKFDVAALFLQQFVDANPGDELLLEIEKKYDTTVFQSLRNVPRWSDDPAVDKKARANVEELIKKSRAANEKILYDPKRVAKFIRNLGASREERGYAELELKRTGDFAVPYMVEELRNTRDRDIFGGLLETIGVMEASAIAGWVAALDGMTSDQQLGVIDSIVARRDILNLGSTAQTDLVPYLWRALAKGGDNPALRQLAVQFLTRLQPGVKVDGKAPLEELVAAARKFYEHSARFASVRPHPDGSPSTVPLWTWDAASEKLVKLPEVSVSKAEEYYGLRYARWALEANPAYDPARGLIIALAAEKAIERAKYGSLAKAEPAVFKLLSDAPTVVLAAQLDRGLNQKRTGLALAMLQVLGERAERDSTGLYLKALSYPDPQVQFAAADALLRSSVNVPADARARIVDILRRAAAAEPGAADTTGTALLADPNHVRADAVAALLRGLGYQVEVVATGRELLRRIDRASDFDLILIDHHTPNPELIDLIGQIRADTKAADRPTLVVASPDKMPPPTFDQMVVRFAALIASTENNVRGDIPAPFNPTDPAYRNTTTEELAKIRKKTTEQRDAGLRRAADSRLGRLNRLINSSEVKLTDSQRVLLNLRAELLTYALLNQQYPFSEDNAPETALQVNKLRRQLADQPTIPAYGAGLPTTDLIKLAERLEADLASVPPRKLEFEKLYAKIDPRQFGMIVETFRDPKAEARLNRQLSSYPGVRVIGEPYGRTALVEELQIAFQDPAQAPRDAAEKRSTQRRAVEWLSRMAMGDISGYEVAAAEKELRAALRLDDLADPAIDAVARFPSAGAQEDLLVLVLNRMRPLPLRTKAADAVIRHIQKNGNSIPKTLIQPLVEASAGEPDLGLRGKLLTLKGMLAFEPGDFSKLLTGYNPPLVAPPAPKAAEKEKEKE